MLHRNLKYILLLIIALMIVSFFTFDLGQYFSLDFFKEQKSFFAESYEAHPFRIIMMFFALYVLVATLSLPGAAILTLVAGALFGFSYGVVIVSFASTLGATLAMLSVRFILGDAIQKKYGHKLKSLNEGFEKEGAFYLFTLRLVPIFPFFMVNLLMGLVKISVGRYFFVSQLGMLPGTIAYVFAGKQLMDINSLADILSPQMLLAFAFIGVMPLLLKKIISSVQNNKIMKKYNKPDSFDYNLVVIGGGAGGLVSSYIASAVKAKVALIEKHKMGGDCLNTGCIPSKAIIRSAKILTYIKNHKDYGIKKAAADIDFKEIMGRVHKIIEKIEPHDSIERYEKLGVNCYTGDAEILDPYRVEINGEILTTRNIIIATGAEPFVPPIEGLDDIKYVTSDTLWDIKKLPKKLLILGGGPIGCELTQSFARLGSDVTQVEMADNLMGREDEEVSQYVQDVFEKEGINVLTGFKAVKFEKKSKKQILIAEDKAGAIKEIAFDLVILALGRRARVTGSGFEKLGIELTNRSTVAADDFMQTNFPNIYVCGDVTGPYQFTHMAAHQAWYAAVNALFGFAKKFKVDYRVVPWCTFVDPEVARVGLNERDAQEQGIEYEVTTYGLDDLDRAIADSADKGFVKVLTPPKSDRILGVTIVGHHAGDLIAEFVLAMKYNLGLNKILGTIHLYPSLAESSKYVAGNWKKAHAPETILNYLEKFHKWRRGGNK